MKDEENNSLEKEDGTESTSVIYYDTKDFISKARVSKNGTIPLNILEFDYSFGYDCTKRFNLCVADPDNLVFASGNLIHFFNIKTNKITFRRCSTGGGIGSITKNPMFNHIAIGENGVDPPIIIYEWPSLEIVTILLKGMTRSYVSLAYSPEGTLLASQGGPPDFLITMWDWQRSIIKLQCKSYGQDIFNVVFSKYLPGRLVTNGYGYIKYWQMAKTFTGLKLQGELHKFGNTEKSNIESVYPMPNEKIISSCEWGNILVWDEGFIRTELHRRNNKPCHTGYVSQFEYVNGNLISIGTDGYVKIWYFETIDEAPPSEAGNFFEAEPVDEYKFENEEVKGELAIPIKFMYLLKQDPSDENNNFWYAQDGNGGIWKLDLSFFVSEKVDKKSPENLLTCHAGPILDMSPCDWGPYLATVGEDNKFCIYNYEKKEIVLIHIHEDKPARVIWLPCSVESTGLTVIIAFKSGVIRTVYLKLLNNDKYDVDNVKLIQVLKPHTKNITRMSINPKHSLLVTGSEDETFFVFNIKIQEESFPNLTAIGYLKVPSAVTFMTWKPGNDTTLFVGCSRGDCIQVKLPEEPQTYTTISYQLTKCKPIIFKFESVKSSILRAKFETEVEIRKMTIIAQKREEIKLLRENNPGILIDDESFIESALEVEAKLPDIYIPKKPNPILIAIYTTNSILLSVAEYDAGYMYEYSNSDDDKKFKYLQGHLVEDCNDEEIQSYLFYNNRKYIIFGMANGEIRVCKINPDNEADFSDYWILPMHDNFNGCIPTICLSYNEKMLLTCGYDGNIFSFSINDDSPISEIEIPVPKPIIEQPMPDVPDIDEDHPSIEEVIVQNENTRISNSAKEDKAKTLETINQLIEEFNSILKKNNNLPLSQRLAEEEFELDPRITKDFDNQLQKEMDLVYKKLEFDVEKSKLGLQKLMNHFIDPITCLPFAVKRILKPNTMIHSLREFKLTGDYVFDRANSARLTSILEKKEETGTHILSTKSSRTLETEDLDDQDNDEGIGRVPEVESFLKGLSPRTIQFHLGEEINRLLKKYRAIKKKLKEQEQEWSILKSKKPSPTVLTPEDEGIIKHAANTIGDYKLKASPNYFESNVVHPSVETKTKYTQIITCRRKIHFRREDFNNQLRDLRTRKVELQKEVNDYIKKLKNIHSEIPVETVKPLPIIPEIDYDVEFPEKNLEMNNYVPMEDRVKESKKKRQSTSVVLPVDDFDEEYEALLMDASYFHRGKPLGGYDDKTKTQTEIRMVRVTVPASVLAEVAAAEKVETKIARDMKRARAARKIHEQNQILSRIHKSYEEFDKQIDDLQKDRFEIVYESVYTELFLLTLHQELIVLKRFQNTEKKLTNKVNFSTKNKKIVTRKVKNLTRKIEEKNNRIAKLQQKINDSTTGYINSIKGNPFYKFLKHICIKKYRPPREDDESSSSSSDSSETSSDDDGLFEGSDDSQKVKMIHVDEKVCPPECSRELYNEAFMLRDKRYEKEFRIKDEQRSIDIWQMELDIKKKKLKAIELELKEDTDNLRAMLEEKQRQLNDIDVTVLLNLHQLQCFTDGGQPEKIQNCVIIDKNQLSQLYKRVGELENDTTEEAAKYKSGKQHFRNVKANYAAMKNNLSVVKGQIKNEMEQKFGQQVSLITLYEAVLQRLIHNVKADSTSLVKFYDNKIKSIKTEYVQQMQLLKNLINENTEKLSVLTVLEEELLKLRKTLNLKLMSEEEISKLESNYMSEINKLKNVIKIQEKQKIKIFRDINFLTSKTKNLCPIEYLDTDIETGKPPLKVIDGKEYSSNYETEDNVLSNDDFSISNDSRETTTNENSQHKKMIAIRHMLSQVTAEDEVTTEETIDNMLIELTQNLKRSSTGAEKIDENIKKMVEKLEIEEDTESFKLQAEREDNESLEMQESFDHDKLSEKSKQHTIGFFDDIEYRFDIEPPEGIYDQEIPAEVCDKLFDLFSKLGIQDNAEEIAKKLVYILRMSEDVNYVSKFILEKLPIDIDSDEKTSLIKDIKETLLDTLELLEFKGIISVKKHTDEF